MLFDFRAPASVSAVGAEAFFRLGGGPELLADRAVLLAAGLFELRDLLRMACRLSATGLRAVRTFDSSCARADSGRADAAPVLELGCAAFEGVDLPAVLRVLRVEPSVGVVP